MKILWRPGLFALALLMARAEARQNEGDEVQGLWKPAEADLGGRKLPEKVLEPLRLELSKGKYTLTGAESPDSGTYTLDDSKKPKAMDVKGTDGPNKGKTFPAIYEIDGDTLRICYDLAGKERPKEFKTARDTKLYLVIYKRDKR